MKLIGIDPGLDGAIAFYDGMDDDPVKVQMLPTTGNGRGREIDLAQIGDTLHEFKPDKVYIEKVAARPGNGVAAMFRFGYTYGGLVGVALGQRIPVELIRPQEWKAVVLMGTDRSKQAAISYCRRAWPHITLYPSPRCRVPNHNIADALCILEYAKRTYVH